MKLTHGICALLIACSGSACGSSAVTYYSLTASPMQASFSSHGGPVIEVRHVRFPGYLNNPQIVTSDGKGEVSVDERNRWVEDLGANFQRTFVQDLSASLNSSDVYVSGFASRPPSVVVEVDVVRFEQDTSGASHLTARWLVSRADSGGKGRSAVAVLTEPAGSSGYEARVAALSRLVGSLASQVAQAVREVGAGPKGS